MEDNNENNNENNDQQKIKYEFDLKIRGIGCFEEEITINFYNCKRNFVIYAENGSGKTFLSRCFELYDKNKIFENKEEIKNKLLSFNNEGEFCFKIEAKYNTNKDENKNKNINENINIKLNKNNLINSIDNTQYIYCVFNKDYIDKQNFKLDEKEGYIITGDTQEIKTLEKQKEENQKNIKDKKEKINDKLNKFLYIENTKNKKDFYRIIRPNSNNYSIIIIYWSFLIYYNRTTHSNIYNIISLFSKNILIYYISFVHINTNYFK